MRSSAYGLYGRNQATERSGVRWRRTVPYAPGRRPGRPCRSDDRACPARQRTPLLAPHASQTQLALLASKQYPAAWLASRTRFFGDGTDCCRSPFLPVSHPYISRFGRHRTIHTVHKRVWTTCGQGVVVVRSPGVHQSVPRSSPCNSVAVHRNDKRGIQMPPARTPLVHSVHSTYY